MDPTWWEAAAVLVIAVLLAGGRWLGVRWRVPGLARALYGSERRAMIAVGLISLSVAAVCTAIRAQGPRVHDEFSYVLAADTFAHGRLTNPTHPMWKHFETMHVLMRPTMQSKYPPAQGLALAAGQALTGHRVTGVWVSFALACMALYWCLRPWTPRRWAFFGALLPCLRFGTGLYYRDNHWTYWASSYWGGAVALLGGCLVLGAALRMLQGKAGRKESLLLGLGLSVLAASRPWEGLALAVPLLLVLTWRLGKGGGLAALGRHLGPALATAALFLCALAFYNFRVTGSPIKLPYQAYMEQYDVVPVFRFQDFRPEPVYGNEQMRQYHLKFQTGLAAIQLRGVGLVLEDVRSLAAFLLGRPLSGAALLGLLFWRNRRLPLLIALLATAGASHALTLINPFWPHYFAPQVPLVVLLALRGLRVMHVWQVQGRRPGAYLANAIVIATIGALIVSATLRARTTDKKWDPYSARLQAIVERLLAEPGDDLILVRYASNHFVHTEWVYNLSDIDEQPIVWARDLGPGKNEDLLEYFRDRQVWLLEADERPPRMAPYQTSEAPGAR
ncbi:MAG: hypothetical protein O3A53_00715 [Acidobacteria bacterium]|nr:hypothetical protein [Acidobacteriota bacterium]